MKNTRETDYAIRCVYCMSKEPNRLHMIKEIAEDQNVPKSFLAKILQKLVKAKIVSSVRGVKGGFILAQKPSQITLLDVIEAIQGPLLVILCVLDGKSCVRKGTCSLHPIWVELQELMSRKLRQYNFKNILRNNMASKNKKLVNLKRSGCILSSSNIIMAPAQVNRGKGGL